MASLHLLLFPLKKQTHSKATELLTPFHSTLQSGTPTNFCVDILRGLRTLTDVILGSQRWVQSAPAGQQRWSVGFILNGHGGPQTAILRKVADLISEEEHVRLLVINWWSLASAETFAVFKENGGHAGNNETAYMQAIVPQHIHPDKYSADMATAYPQRSSWHAVPFPSSIGLYEKGQGYPTFDEKQGKEYFGRVNNRVAELIEEVIRKWDMAALYRD